jgi:hypothetical protein
MKDDPRLTRLHNEPDTDAHIIDAEFEEVEPEHPASTPSATNPKRLRMNERFSRKPWYVKLSAFLFVGLFGIIMLSALGVGGSDTPEHNAPAEDTATSSAESIAPADDGANQRADNSEASAAAEPPLEDAECLRPDTISQVGREASRLMSRSYIDGTVNDPDRLDPDEVEAMYRTAHISLSDVRAFNRPSLFTMPYPCTGSIRIAMKSQTLGPMVVTISHARWTINYFLSEDKGWASAPFQIYLDENSLIQGTYIDGKKVTP